MKTTHMLTILMVMSIMCTTSVMGQNRSMGRRMNYDSGRPAMSQPVHRYNSGAAVHHSPTVHHQPAIRHHRPAPRPVYYATPRHCPPPPPPHHYHSDAAGIVAGAVVATTVGLLLGSLAY